MAYSQSELKGRVEEVQLMLRLISYFNPNVPAVLPDGIYGPKTAVAVKDFQKEYDLPQTGEVDPITWSVLTKAYRASLLQSKVEHIKPNHTFEAPVSTDTQSDVVFLIQIILKYISNFFVNVPSPEISGIYDSATKQAVNILQTMSLLTPSGDVDRETWNILAKSYNVL